MCRPGAGVFVLAFTPEGAAELEEEIIPEGVQSEVDVGYLASLLS